MIYLGKGGRIPYLSREKIEEKTEEVLKECWSGDFPVDVEMICDNLRIGILPIPGLSKTFRVDAFISADFKSIYVDKCEFEKNSNRYRFSVAHELGHYILHQKYCPSSAKDLKAWFEIFNKFVNNYAEFQANHFAGSLLVPELELIRVLNDEFDGSFIKNYWYASINEKSMVLMRLRKHFSVSDEVIARRIRDAFPGVGEK